MNTMPVEFRWRYGAMAGTLGAVCDWPSDALPRDGEEINLEFETDIGTPIRHRVVVDRVERELRMKEFTARDVDTFTGIVIGNSVIARATVHLVVLVSLAPNFPPRTRPRR